MRIVTPEQSMINIESISTLKRLNNSLLGLKCKVNNISFFTPQGELQEKKLYKNCMISFSQNVIILKNGKNDFWKLNLSLSHFLEDNARKLIIYKNEYDEKYKLLFSDEENSLTFVSDEIDTPVVKLELTKKYRDNWKLKKFFSKSKQTVSKNSLQTLMDELNKAEKHLNNESFHLIKGRIVKGIRKDPKSISDIIYNNKSSSTAWIYGVISNIAGDYVESGEYHIYRGVLNPVGNDLLKLFDGAINNLLEIGIIENDYAKQQKKAVRENIKGVG